MTDVIIRPATTDDIPDIRRIARLGWTTTYGEFLASDVIDWVIDEWYDAGIVTRSITDEAVAYFVAEERGEEYENEGRVIGYASGDVREGNHGSVGTLYVHPDHWGEGIGTRLFETVLDTLREWGAEWVEIHVLAENDVGISFYESHGFECIREGTSEFGGTTQREYVYTSAL
jgi:ribosomal protein S18 acetylase RimI-like enzyme